MTDITEGDLRRIDEAEYKRRRKRDQARRLEHRERGTKMSDVNEAAPEPKDDMQEDHHDEDHSAEMKDEMAEAAEADEAEEHAEAEAEPDEEAEEAEAKDEAQPADKD